MSARPSKPNDKIPEGRVNSKLMIEEATTMIEHLKGCDRQGCFEGWLRTMKEDSHDP